MKRTWDAKGLATAAVMAGWAAMFWFLWLSGRWALYLSTRTYWVVPLGASILTVAALGRLRSSRVTQSSAGLTGGDRWRLAVIALPAIVVMALPSTTLGAYAVSRRPSLGVAVAPSGDVGNQLSIFAVAKAQYYPDAMEQLVKRAGEQVTYVGFVTREGDTPTDEFILNRFIITCCVNDALVAQVHVVDVPPGAFGTGDWVRVTGLIYPVRTDVLLDAVKVTHIARPAHPYITP